MNCTKQKACGNCEAPATHTGSHWEAGRILVCLPCTVNQQFSHLESLNDRDKRVREILSIIRKQEEVQA